MRITAEMSFYPLSEEFIPSIKAFIAELATRPDLHIVTNRMSTQITGEFGSVTSAINHCMEVCMSGPGRSVLVVKYINTALPLDSAPDLD